MPTLGAYEVETKDGYVVSARDTAGFSWTADEPMPYIEVKDGCIVFARDPLGEMAWAADVAADLVSSLRAELDGRQKKPSSGWLRTRKTRRQAAVDILEIEVGANEIARRRARVRPNAIAADTHRVAWDLVRTAYRAVAPDGVVSYRRMATHAMVLGAAVAPMSVTIASAHTAPMQRVELPANVPDNIFVPPDQAATTTDALHAANAVALAEATALAAPAAAAGPPPPAARPYALRAPSAGTGGHFPWGWCTWYVSSKRYVPWMGNAREWFSNARAMGYAVGPDPRAGAIMVTRESWWGHVAFVESVDPDGRGFTVTEMNYRGFGVVSSRHFTSTPSVAVGFIY